MRELRNLPPEPGLKIDGRTCIVDNGVNGIKVMKLGVAGQLGSNPRRCKVANISN